MPAEDVEPAYIFDRYRFLPRQRRLFAGEEPVEIGSRALEILAALIEADGKLVTTDALRKRVWPTTVVEDHNVQVQISMLRRAFGEDRDLIRNEAGRGYRLATTVRTTPTQSYLRTNVPTPISALIGREQELQELTDLVGTHRLITLTGAGGIGKTRLGAAVGRAVLTCFSDGVWLIELGSLTDPELVPTALARALGVELGSNRSPTEQLLAILGRKHLLLLLDNCEHVVDAVAAIAETLLRGAPRLHMLVTSQEPLAAEGERIHRVTPLKVPPEDRVSAAEAADHGAVRLFAERMRAADPTFSLDEQSAPLVSKICRQLDGIPLAIELAAPRAACLGLDEVASRLDDRFRLLTAGRRTALRRHQTLAATLDWSYALLQDAEKAVLRRLAVFVNGFTLASAIAVATRSDIDESQAANHVATLTSKSLVTFEVHGQTRRYRLLETTRAYAVEKLVECGELDAVARLHAQHYREMMTAAEAGWYTTPVLELMARFAPEIGNIHGALSWAFAPHGDADIGVALTAASVPLWTLLSMFSQCRNLVRHALTHLSDCASPLKTHEMRLQAALATSSIWSEGPTSETRNASERALNLADELGNADLQLQALYMLWVYRLRSGEYRIATDVAEKFRQIAEDQQDSSAILTAARVKGVSLFYMGDYASARAAMERVLADTRPGTDRSYMVRFGKDQRVTAVAYLLRILWLQGFPSQAVRMTPDVIAEAQCLAHANSLCCALDSACSVMALSGDLDGLEELATALCECAEKHGLAMWHGLGKAFKAVAMMRRGERVRGLDMLKSTLDSSKAIRIELRHTIFAEAFAFAGHAGEARALVQRTLDTLEQNGGYSNLPELLRLRGELALRDGGSIGEEAAEKDFADAIDMARRHGARSWELRAATSLARLWQARGQHAQARELLMPVYGAFVEDFETADLAAARTLLESLQ
jgi:predicted ATPase/DNA-binding winged helix-turn-helix (wHTH) protein